MSKTRMGVKIAFSVVLIALIQGVLSFYRIDVLLGAYGDKVNGVVQAALQMSTYLILFQTGMSAAYQYHMYAPLSDSDYPRISSLFGGLQRSMLRVTGKMLMIALVVIPVYSALLLNQGVQYWDTLLILAAVGIRISAPFYYTLPERCLIEIKEKKYIVVTVEGVKDIITIIAEILLIRFTPLPLPLILCVNLVFLALSKLVYRRQVLKLYGPAFDPKAAPEYVASKMTNAVYAHQISSMVTSNTDNVVLSLLSSLKNVTVYSAFATLVSYPNVVIFRIIEGMRATLALKITRGDEDSYSAFKELLAFSFFCICVCVPVFLQLANPFVSLWIGSEYVIPMLPLVLFALLLADHLFMPVIYAARDARGMYAESKKFTIAQAIVNLVISVALASFLGITGVLAGTIAAAYLVLQPGNFRLVYKQVFGRKLTIYRDFAIAAAICTVSYFACGLAIEGLYPAGEAGWTELIIQAVVCAAITGALAFVGLWMTNDGFRMLVRRFLNRRSSSPAKAG